MKMVVLIFSRFLKMLIIFQKIVKENGEKNIRSNIILCLLVEVKIKHRKGSKHAISYHVFLFFLVFFFS